MPDSNRISMVRLHQIADALGVSVDAFRSGTHTPHDPVHDLMRTLAEGIKTDEAFADNFSPLAFSAKRQGNPEMADAFMRLGRMHQVKAIELRARLAALVERYGAREL